MKFTVPCTYCQKKYQVEERLAGRRVKCKNCGEIFVATKPPEEDEVVDLSAYAQNEVVDLSQFAAPPAPPPPRAAAASPPLPPALPQQRVVRGEFPINGRQAAMGAIAVVLMFMLFRAYSMIHDHFYPPGGWDIGTAASMTLAQKRDQTLSNVMQIGPTLVRNLPSVQVDASAEPRKLLFNDLPRSLFISPFGAASADANDYGCIHLDRLREHYQPNAIILYDESELAAGDGTTVFRADGVVEHISQKEFEDQRDVDRLVLNPPQPPLTRPMPMPMDSSPAPRIPPPIVVSPPLVKTPPRDLRNYEWDPIIPAHAWHAEPDLATEVPQMSPHVRLRFKYSPTFYFPDRPSRFLFVNNCTPQWEHVGTTAQLWDLQTVQCVSTIPAIKNLEEPVLSPDGDLFGGRVNGPWRGPAKYQVWSTRTGKLLNTLNAPAPTGRLTPKPADFIGLHQLLVVGDTFEVWDIDKGTIVCKFGDVGTEGIDPWVALSPHGKLLAVVTDSRFKLSLYSTETGALLGTTPIPEPRQWHQSAGSYVSGMRFSPDGRELALELGGSHLFVWNVADGSIAKDAVLQQAPLDDQAGSTKIDANDKLIWFPDGQDFLIGGDRIVDRATGRQIGGLLPPLLEIRAGFGQNREAKEQGVRQVIDNSHLLLRFSDSMPDAEGNLFDDILESMPIPPRIADKKAILAAPPPLAGVNGNPPPAHPTTMPDHAWTADVDTPTLTPRINPGLRAVFPGKVAPICSPQPSNWIVLNRLPDASETNKQMHNLTGELFNLRTAAGAATFPALPDMHDAILSPDGEYVVGRNIAPEGEPTSYLVYSARTGKLLQTLPNPPAEVSPAPRPIGFLPGGLLVTADDQFNVWDLATGKHLRKFGPDLVFDPNVMIGVSANCKLIAVVWPARKAIWLLSAETGAALGTCPIPDKYKGLSISGFNVARGVVFSPDGKELAMLSSGTDVFIWSVADGHLAKSFKLSPGVMPIFKMDRSIDTLAWFGDGQSFLIGGHVIVDRTSGAVICQTPEFSEGAASEFGQRRVIDPGHLMLGFHAFAGTQSALESLPIDAKAIARLRDAARAAATTQPAPQPEW